jgi:putative flippase GtrA
MRRWGVFNGVGLLGFGVQLAVLATLLRVLDLHYLLGTVIAVEAALLHNFVWHQRWTWRDRPDASAWPARLLRFHLVNGVTSIAGNLVVMHLLTGVLQVPPIAASAMAVGVCSIVNFLWADAFVFAAALVLVVPSPAAAAGPELAIELQPSTFAAWRKYEAQVDERYNRLTETRAPFFVHDEFKRAGWRDAARKGDVAMTRLEPPAIPDGKVHHWVGAVFVPGATVNDVVRRLQEGAGQESRSYDDVLASKLLSRDGDRVRIFMKLRRESVITVTYNTEHAVEYRHLGPARASSRSVATKIAELADAGTAREREKPAGTDQGFLWRLNAYWRYEQAPDGVFIECESISLSRGVPVLLRLFITRAVEGIARDALDKTLRGVRKYLTTRDPSTLRHAQGRPERSRGTTGSGSSRAKSRDDGSR